MRHVCISRCDSSPYVLIATKASDLALRRARAAGARRGHRSRSSWGRPPRRGPGGGLTAARRRPTARPNHPRGSGSSSSWPAIAGISTSISSERSPGTKPFEFAWIGASWNAEHIPAPMPSNGAAAIDACPVRTGDSYARLAGSSFPWGFPRLIEALPANVGQGSAEHVDCHGRGAVTDSRRAPLRQ